ncbi:hypothetical protein LguiA_006400 [Lonicera macranthoides]
MSYPHCRIFDLASSSSSSSSSSCSLFSFESFPVKHYDMPWRIFSASVKGFVIGAGLAFFAILVRLRRRQLLTSVKKVEMASSSQDTILAVKETLRYGLFLDIFAGTFVTARWRALLAGAIAGPSMLLTGLNTQHTSLAIYILMRATVLASRCGIKSKRSSYILKQESLPPPYKSFLNKHGGKAGVILQGMKEIASGKPFSNLEVIEKYYKTVGIDIELDPQMKIPCTTLHNFGERSSGYSKIKLVSVHVLLISMFPTGLALAIEKKSRRIDISLYCLARAIESFFTCMADVGYLPESKNLKKADVVVFSISTAIIMHCYAIKRDIFRSKYLNILDWVFGVPLPLPETSGNNI